MELKTVDPVVFSDSRYVDANKYCEDVASSCQFLHEGCCNLFPKKEGLYELISFPQELEIDWLDIRSGVEDDIHKKCPECKEHYQKAIEANKKETDHRTQHQKQMDKHFIGH